MACDGQSYFASETMEQVYLSLGSNLGDRVANLREAIRRLRTFAAVTAVSAAYESEPVEYTAQSWFLNAVVALRFEAFEDSCNVSAEPLRLLAHLQAIEREMGRRRDAALPKGPRTIDLDLVLYGHRVIQSPVLVVPHPAMQARRFVLEPLTEIAPEAEHPILHQTALELLRALPLQGALVRRWGTLGIAAE
jgi:2-amino-4-hydroxy-6-hydroxymethyldihydropteridine diphosphokinase